MDVLRRLDDRLLTAVNDLARHTSWLHGVVRAYAAYGAVVFAVLLLTALGLRRSAPDRVLAAAAWTPLAVLLAVGLNQPLVNAVAEARPYTTHPDLLVLANRSSDFSFPSDHAVMAGAATAGLWLTVRALGAAAAAAALVMAFARVYIGAHYPWDVLAGLVLGAAVALLGWMLLRGLLTAFTGWLRARPPMRRVFRETATVPGRAAENSSAP